MNLMHRIFKSIFFLYIAGALFVLMGVLFLNSENFAYLSIFLALPWWIFFPRSWWWLSVVISMLINSGILFGIFWFFQRKVLKKQNKSVVPSTYILLGPPGSGKSTLAGSLVERFGLEHVDIGSVLREVARHDTPLGHEVDRIIHVEKALVPDSVIEQALHYALGRVDATHGIILDGAPRCLSQVAVVEGALSAIGRTLDRVIFLRVEESLVVARIASRYYCTSAERHLVTLGREVSAATDPCPHCGASLMQRIDDTPDGVRKRYSVFMTETMPVIEHYREGGQLLEVDGALPLALAEATLIEQLESEKDA
jgi:adenylate kinase